MLTGYSEVAELMQSIKQLSNPPPTRKRSSLKSQAMNNLSYNDPMNAEGALLSANTESTVTGVSHERRRP